MRDLLLEVDGGVATLTINRPESRNALALQTMVELDQAIDLARGERARVLLVRGAGNQAFCAGGDLKELEHLRSEKEAAGMAQRMRATLDRLPQLPFPVVAGLNGDALGGGAELALACDFRFAAAGARIGFAQVTLGLIPAWGSSERLAALVGRGRAMYLLLTGEAVAATQAFQLGLVEHVVSDEEFDSRLRTLGEAIAAAPPAAVAGIKSSVNAVQPHRYPRLARGDIEAFARTWADPAHWEAVAKLDEQRRQKKKR